MLIKLNARNLSCSPNNTLKKYIRDGQLQPKDKIEWPASEVIDPQSSILKILYETLFH